MDSYEFMRPPDSQHEMSAYHNDLQSEPRVNKTFLHQGKQNDA